MNRTLIPLITKLSAPKPKEWFKYLSTAQLFLNTTPHRSIGVTPFRLLFGVHARIQKNPNMRELIESEWMTAFEEKRDELRFQAKGSIKKVQEENRHNYNKKRSFHKEHSCKFVMATVCVCVCVCA